MRDRCAIAGDLPSRVVFQIKSRIDASLIRIEKNTGM